jgi:hypothetical protein
VWIFYIWGWNQRGDKVNLPLFPPVSYTVGMSCTFFLSCLA